MDAKSLVEEAKHLDGYYKDLAGISSRVFPDKFLEEGVEVIAEFVLGYKQMWHDAGNQDPSRQVDRLRGFQPLYRDDMHQQRNLSLRAVDYLETFREFTRRWAARTHGIDAQDSWFRAQDQFAEMISKLMKKPYPPMQFYE